MRLIIKHKNVGKRKQCQRVKNRRGTSEVQLICILDQFLYFPVARKGEKKDTSSKYILVSRQRNSTEYVKKRKMMVKKRGIFCCHSVIILLLYIHSMWPCLKPLLYKCMKNVNLMQISKCVVNDFSFRLWIEDRCHPRVLSSIPAGFYPEILHHGLVQRYWLSHWTELGWIVCKNNLICISFQFQYIKNIQKGALNMSSDPSYPVHLIFLPLPSSKRQTKTSCFRNVSLVIKELGSLQLFLGCCTKPWFLQSELSWRLYRIDFLLC